MRTRMGSTLYRMSEQGSTGGQRRFPVSTERRSPVVPPQHGVDTAARGPDSGGARREGSRPPGSAAGGPDVLDGVIRRMLGPGRHRVSDLFDLLRGAGPQGLDGVRATAEAFPKLAHERQLGRALRAARGLLRPGGVLVAAVPELDRLRRLRTAAGPPRVTRSGDDRELTVKVWDWSQDGESYGLEVLRLTCQQGRWELRDVTAARHRVLSAQEVGARLSEAGFDGIRRLTHEHTGHRVPVWVALAPEQGGPRR